MRKASDPRGFYVEKITQVHCCCKRRLCSCVATLQFTADTSQKHKLILKKPTEFYLGHWIPLCLPSAYCGIDAPILTSSREFFPLWHVRWGKLKPRHIFQTGIFTSLLFNPVTPIVLKNTSVFARVCVTCLIRLQTANQYSPLLRLALPTMASRQPANQHEARRWPDKLTCDLYGESHKDCWMFAEWK